MGVMGRWEAAGTLAGAILAGVVITGLVGGVVLAAYCRYWAWRERRAAAASLIAEAAAAAATAALPDDDIMGVADAVQEPRPVGFEPKGPETNSQLWTRLRHNLDLALWDREVAKYLAGQQ